MTSVLGTAMAESKKSNKDINLLPYSKKPKEIISLHKTAHLTVTKITTQANAPCLNRALTLARQVSTP